ncbi:thioesterase II family protein [Chitinophaga sp. LS1]|uniref:thioesterase II family protein n=1 Tax=Chitinophaga sp. LS1 TaxID=3051176 RepID=UPI002AAC1744|nr:alpha/beta fold hydrolase [Chitinophaga sp. LS1]WPV63811.1 thioesterase domain-containing protein [Chitinophaga sp. LS1]
MDVNGVQLFIFPHAGGSDLSYRSLERKLQITGTTFTICYPGRAKRFNEPFAKDVPSLAKDCMDIITLNRQHDLPMVFLGHSLGALVAYETIKCLRTSGSGLPELVFLTGRSGPCEAPVNMERHELADGELITHLSAMGGIDLSLLTNPDFISFFLPVIRNDLRLNDTYKYCESNRFDIPFVLLNGSNDRIAETQALLSWQKETLGICIHEFLDGGHFFLLESPDFSKKISQFIHRYVICTQLPYV